MLNKSTLVSLRPLLGDLLKAIRGFDGPKIAGILNELASSRFAMLKDQAISFRNTIFRGKAFLDKIYGTEREVLKVFKPWEKKPNGELIINRTLQTSSGQTRITLKPGKTYIWGIDGDGKLLVAETILGGAKPHMKLGHPSLNGGRPLRIAGELHFDPGTGVGS